VWLARPRLALALLVLAVERPSSAAPAKSDGLGVPFAPSDTSWLGAAGLGGRAYRLSPEPWARVLERFLEPYRNHTPAWRAFWRGGNAAITRPWLSLCWSKNDCAPGRDAPAIAAGIVLAPLRLEARGDWPARSLDDLLIAPEPQPLAVTVARRCAPWRAPPAVTFVRAPNESDRFRLLECDGSVTTDALDRLSVLARPTGAERPSLPLPFDPIGGDGEWVPDVRLLSPRLVWALSRFAEAFPGHPIEIVSGYRRSGHGRSHARGQALDFAVRGVPKESVFAVCRRLRDVGCGYYPENRFVHLDVRAYGTGHVAWVDASLPGEPSRYVDGWPGVLSPARDSASRPGP
jgi:hypothetical protein